MVRWLFIFLFCSIGQVALAQHDPVLMTVNGEKVYRSDFNHYYHKYDVSGKTEAEDAESAVDQFVNFKLKVQAAEGAGMDTVTFVRNRLEDYRRKLLLTYLMDKEQMEHSARHFYDKIKDNDRAETVCVKQIFKSLPQNLPTTKIRRAEQQMDSIYQELQESENGVSFDVFVKKFSDEKDSCWITSLQTSAELEDIAFNLPVGKISKPFFTPQGIHIIKVIGKKKLPPFERMKDEIIMKLMHHHSVSKETESLVEKLKEEYHYTPNKKALDKLRAERYTEDTLFTLGSKAYTGIHFSRFASAHSQGIERQLTGFIIKTVLDYENQQLERKYPEFGEQLQFCRDSMLFAAITEHKVIEPSLRDESGLKAYFDKHRADYRWKEKRYKGIVLHCVSKKTAKHARKFLKKLPEDEWLDAIRLTFNSGKIPQIQAEKGTFAPGDNVYIDDLVFRGEDAPPILSFPYTSIVGKKRKGPDNYKEVRQQLTTDYQSSLERKWIAELREKSKVEINEEVLKTVNNH